MRVPQLHRLLLVSLALLLAVWASPAVAAKPEFEVIDVNDFGVLGDCDGFQVLQEVTGTIKISHRTTANGTEIQISRYSLRETYTNSETGESVSTPDVGIDKLTINPDGSATLVVIGLLNRIVIPGEGLIVANAGRLVFFFTGPNEEPDVVFEAGPSGDLLPALCTVLAP
jgi:hypothetical protein